MKQTANGDNTFIELKISFFVSSPILENHTDDHNTLNLVVSFISSDLSNITDVDDYAQTYIL